MTLLYASRASDLAWHLLIGKRGQDHRLKIVVRRHAVMSTAMVVMSPWYGWWPLVIWLSACLSLAGQRTYSAVRWWTFRRQVVTPTVSVLDPVVRKHSPSGQGLVHLDIPRDFRDNVDSKIVVHLPMDWTPTRVDMSTVTTLLCQRLSTDTLTAAWTLAGRKPHVTFAMPAKPPDKLGWSDMLAAADNCKDSSLIMGQGTRGGIVTFDLAMESPHLLLAAGSGAGKSELLAWLVGQFMRRGYGVMVLDAKFVSHMWLRRVPGVLYAAEGEELHEALVWLKEELMQRARYVSSGGDSSTLIPLVCVMEEMNGASNRLRQYWRDELQGKGMSPALNALADLANMGRELRVHILTAGQSMTAKATGGPEARESFGGRALARATQNQWKMLAPQIKPAPAKQGVPGRWHLVVGDSLREFQAPFCDIKGEPARLIEWATGGAPVVDVPALVWGGGGTEHVRNRTSEASQVPPTPQEGISLRRAAEEWGVELKTVTRWRERRSDFPVEIGYGANNTKLYDQDHLKAYVRERLREPVEGVA